MVLLVSCAFSIGWAAEEKSKAETKPLRDLLERFSKTQRDARSLSAHFVERKNLNLLAKPVVSTGEFFYRKPGRIKWEYAQPERRVYLITEDRYLAYYPEQKRAENVPLSKFSSRPFFKFLGIGQTAEELQKYFEISMPDTQSKDGAYLLLLTPKWQRIKDRLALVRFWVDEKSCLPSKLEYVETDGDSTTLTFSRFQVNPDIAETRFSIELPRDVQVSKSLSGLNGGSMSQ
jgi:outer membrane lipoprotein carrier protein